MLQYRSVLAHKFVWQVPDQHLRPLQQFPCVPTVPVQALLSDLQDGGVDTQVPLLQKDPPGHVPPLHLPEQPSGAPHAMPVQLGTHTQVPAELHFATVPHVPQVPPHPSVPQAFPVQFGIHVPTEVGFTTR
jgi:hypothetical protein